MVHSQPQTPAEMDNTESDIIINETSKQNRYRSIDMIFYWVRDIIQQNHFHTFGNMERKTWRIVL